MLHAMLIKNSHFNLTSKLYLPKRHFVLNSFKVNVHVYVPESNYSDYLDHINTGQYIY